MSLTDRIDQILPTSFNEFDVYFLKGLYEDVSANSVDLWQVTEAVRAVCTAKSGGCARDKVGDVLVEVERRENLQRALFWDMKFLLGEEGQFLELDNVFILFKTYFGSKFLTKDWEMFLKKRIRSGPASFLELRNAMCNFNVRDPATRDPATRDPAEGDPAEGEQVEALLEKLKEPTVAVKYSETDTERDNRRQRYRNKAKQWLGKQSRQLQAGVVDKAGFVTALQKKYTLLCKVALKQALEREKGEEAWLIKTEGEKEDLIAGLEAKVDSLRKMGRLLYCDHALQLKGLLTIKGGLYNVMGLSQYESKMFTTKMIKHREKLFRGGKDESYVKEREMEEYTQKRKDNEGSSTNILNDLDRRLSEELWLLRKQLDGGLGRVWGLRERETMLALLYFHQYRACGESAFRPSVISVSLAEHVSSLPEERLFEDYDKWYDLARYRVTSIIFEDDYDRLTGLPLIPLSLPPAMSLTASQNTIRDCFIVLQRAHDAECVYLQMLLYSDLEEEDHIKLLSSSEAELEDALAYLRQQRLDWRLRFTAEQLEQRLEEQCEMLRNAMFIKVLLVQYKHNLLDDADSAMVVLMSELIQLQETETAILVTTISTKSSDEAAAVQDSITRRMKLGCNDNVAHVLVQGVAEHDDNALLEIIYRKYESLKRVWIRQTVKKSENRGMSEDEMLIKERDMYSAGELYDAKNIFGSCVSHESGLHGLMGPNREITEDQWLGAGDDKVLFEQEPSDNILMDIQFRYKDDKAFLLTELKNAGSRQRIYEHALLQFQIYVLQEYNEFDVAASYVGLVEKVHIHPQYKLSRNTEVLKRIAEHVLCCHAEQHSFQHIDLLSHNVFLEETFRQVLRKTMVYLLQKKHAREQSVFSYTLNKDAAPAQETVDISEEKTKLREIRQELCSGQIAGTFLASLQNKQMSIFQELAAHSSKSKADLMSELLFCQINEAATCIADMLTMGKLELSVLVSSVRSGITSGYNDNISHILCAEDPGYRCKMDIEQWLTGILRKMLMSGAASDTEKDSREDVFKRLKCETDEPADRSYLDGMGIKIISSSEVWGLLPTQFSSVLEATKIEEQLLKDEELSEEERKVRILEVFKRQSKLCYQQDGDVILALSRYRSETLHVLGNQHTVTLATLYCCYGNLLNRQPLIPWPVVACYVAHIMRMLVSVSHVTREAGDGHVTREAGDSHVIHEGSVRSAATALLAGYTAEWAAKTPLGSSGMLSLVRDYSTIHYTITSYRKYILSCLHKHHAMELSLFCRLLLDSDVEVEEAMSQSQRIKEMTSLHGQWDRVQTELRAMTMFNERSADQLKKLHEQQRSLLSSSLSLKYGSVMKRIRYRQRSGKATVEGARVELLSELITHHIHDISDSIRSLHDMTMLELASLKITLHHNIKAGIVGSIAVVCFTPLLLDKNEQVAQELEDKYDKLKDKLYAATLIKEIGEKEWVLMSEKERQKKILKLRRQAIKLKKEDKESEMEKMFADALANDKGMIELIGMSKEQYLKSLEEKRKLRKETRKKTLEDGTEVEEEVQVDEDGNVVEKKFTSILEALDNNFESEKDELMARLRESSDQFACARERQAMMVRLRLEKKKLEQQGNFDEAALILGQANAMGERQLSEKERQIALAKARIAARKNKLAKANSKTGLIESRQDIDIETEDAGELQEKLAELVHVKHEGEREILQQLLENMSTEEKDSVRGMTKKERQQEIGLLREDRKKWREDIGAQVPSAEHLIKQQIVQKEWLKQAALLNLFNILADSETEYNMTIEDEDKRKEDFERRREEEGIIKILVELQEKQDDEAAMLLGNIKHKGLIEIQSMCLTHKRALDEGWHDNIAAVVFARQTASSEAEMEVVKELEKKYDNIKDKLILQMLEQQMGADEWARLSEKDRQKKLMQLKLRERQLRVAGRENEADELYKAMIDVQKVQEEREGELKRRQKERIKSRLEHKKKRQAEGASKEEIETELGDMKRKEEELDNSNKESVSAKDILASLVSNFDSEKEMLLSQIRDGDGKIKSEKERQLAILKLKREQLRIKKDAEMDAAALVFGKARAKDKQVEDARAQQLFLAKQRMLARKGKQKTEGEVEEEDYIEDLKDIANSEDASATLQDSILHLMEQKHETERDLFMKLVHKLSEMKVLSEEELLAIRSKPPSENEARLVTLRRQRLRSLKSIKTAKDQEQEEERKSEFKDIQEAYLQDGLAIKILSLFPQQDLAAACPEGKLSDMIETAAVELLATIQLRQEGESEALLTAVNDMNVGQMSEVRQVIHGNITSAQYDNLCTVILGEVTPEDLTVKIDQLNIVKSKRDKDLKAVMEKRKKERQAKKLKKKENLALLLNDLNSETDRSVQDVTQQYEKYKDALDQLLKKKDLVNLSVEEEAMLAKAREILALVGDQTDVDSQDLSKTLHTLTQDNKDELYRQLKQQHLSQVNQINAQREAQKKAMLAKLKIKAAVKEKKEDEEDTMMSMFGDFSRSQTIVREKTIVGKSAAKEKLAGILARKKETAENARKAREEALRKEKEERIKSEEVSISSLPSTPSSTERPGDRLLGSRENSRISKVELSVHLGEDDKKELLDSLVRQVTTAEVSKSRQRSKQAEQLRARIRARQMAGPGSAGTKRDKVQEEAEEILGAMERDKTQLQFVHSQESERQKTIIRDRIRRIREKTMTGDKPPVPAFKRQESDLGFSSHLTPGELKLPKNEQMQLVASRMQDKFKKSAGDVQALAVLGEEDAD